MWIKTNHGGIPTTNEDLQYAIFIGRFQPYHYGHIELINQKLEKGIPVLIMVRNIKPDERNPFTTQQTMDMIRAYHVAKKQFNQVAVISIPDIESVNYGRGVGYEINEFQPTDENKAKFISATKIRDSIKNGDDDWRNMVDESIQSLVYDYLQVSLIETK
jgi:cytidyltransferase-like protein